MLGNSSGCSTRPWPIIIRLCGSPGQVYLLLPSLNTSPGASEMIDTYPDILISTTWMIATVAQHMTSYSPMADPLHNNSSTSTLPLAPGTPRRPRWRYSWPRVQGQHPPLISGPPSQYSRPMAANDRPKFSEVSSGSTCLGILRSSSYRKVKLYFWAKAYGCRSAGWLAPY